MENNNHKGKFIVFEGIDGSGKATQTKLLVDYLKKAGREVVKIDFPQYGKKSAGLVEEYLNGKYGTAKQIGPLIASMFYACDRYDASFEIKKWLKQNKIIIADRYIASSMGHQGGKMENIKERSRYFKWLHNLEYGLFKIPKPNVIIILKTSAGFSQKLSHQITDKEKRKKRQAYLGSKKWDIHEKNNAHLQNALNSYLQAAEEFPKDFKVIKCIKNQKLLPPEIIHQKILKVIKPLFQININ